MFPGKAFDETRVGEAFSTSLTVTETHLVLAAGLFGDFNPLHVDDAHAAKSRFGGRILHGPFTSALISAPAGMYFHGTAIAYLEHNCRFKAPVRPGDTLRTTWTIVERLAKPKHGGGILALRASCQNQHGDVVAEADGKLLVASRKELK
jgi:3-hydroxybutyryl-CoA dehydratase